LPATCCRHRIGSRPEGLLADGDVIVELAEKLAVSLPLPDAVDARVRELVLTPPAAPTAADLTRTRGWPPAPASCGDRRAHDLHRRRHPGVRHSHRGVAHAAARVDHPETANALGVAAGDLVNLTAAGAALRELIGSSTRVSRPARSRSSTAPGRAAQRVGQRRRALEKALVTA